MTPLLIAGYNQGGLVRDKKPFMVPNEAFSRLENAYVWRDSVLKRNGLELIGRLKRCLTSYGFYVTGASAWSTNILTVSGLVSGADTANPGEITTPYPHGLTNGDTVFISGVAGATGYNTNSPFTITVTSTTTFTVGVDAAAYGAYTSGGQWISDRALSGAEPNAEIEPGSVTIVAGAVTFTDFNKSGTVTGASAADPCEITTGETHALTTGDTVALAALGGMTELNGESYTVTVTGTTTFTLDGVDSTDFTAYTVGGTWTSSTAQGNGQLFSTTAGNSGTINYLSGAVELTHTVGAAAAVTISYCYFPGLPVQGITLREIATINQEQSIIYDTKYAYVFSGTGFQEFIPGTVWSATNSDFYWSTNYRGANPEDRLYFVTNFVNDASNPMRYTDGATWTDFAPTVDNNTNFLFQARILLPYYGRMIALNVWEGTTVGGAANIFNRCRYSQIGNPIEAHGAGPPATGAWRSDVQGKGGFIDAPTNEAIVSATFIKNTLLVQFERSTWQLRYVGEYGIPFIWERVSSDFGAESTFSTVLFDDGILAVGDKAIVQSNANTVARIDQNIPDQVFNIQNRESGTKRVQAVRDFFKELVYWCYPDTDMSGTGSYARIFPNKVLVYNYKNNSFAVFDDRITALGAFQYDINITWDSLTAMWDDEDIFWDDDPTLQSQFPLVVCGNQQGYIHKYNSTSVENPSMSITGIDTTVSPNQITVINHNLDNTTSSAQIQPNDEGYTVKVTETNWSGTDPDLDDKIYAVVYVDADTLELYEWDGEKYNATSIAAPAAGTYIGGGELTVFPQMFVQSKDFNPFIEQMSNLKLIYADFLTDYSENGEVAVELYMNTSYNIKANVLTGQKTCETDLPVPFYGQGSDLAWHRVNATAHGQFVRICLTFNDDQMNDQDVLNSKFTLNAMRLWVRPGAQTIF